MLGRVSRSEGVACVGTLERGGPRPRGHSALKRDGPRSRGRSALERGGLRPRGRSALERGGSRPRGRSVSSEADLTREGYLASLPWWSAGATRAVIGACVHFGFVG
jgi:hypothetical protein